MQIIRLIYASIAREHLHFSDLVQIRQLSKANNYTNHISGILCYGNGSFLQLLEGERANVNKLYRSIMLDPRHSGLELLSCLPIRKPLFGEWSMKMISLEEPFAAHRRAVLARHTGNVVFDPMQLTGTRAFELFRDLAEVERAHAASADDRVIQGSVRPAA